MLRKAVFAGFLALLTAACGDSIAPIESMPASVWDGAGQALREAAILGDENAVSQLLKQGVAPDDRDETMTSALMLAGYYGHAGVMRVLLDAGASVALTDLKNQTPLYYTASGANPEGLQLLLERGADVAHTNAEGWTALMIASAEGQAANVELLLAAGAPLDVRDADGDSALSFARQNGHAKVVELLEQAGAL